MKPGSERVTSLMSDRMRLAPRQERSLLGAVAFLAFASGLGCAAKRYPLPMTAAELSGYGQGAALAAYLSQPDASGSVCDLHARGPHLARLDDETRNALDRGFREEKIAPRLWGQCVAALSGWACPPPHRGGAAAPGWRRAGVARFPSVGRRPAV